MSADEIYTESIEYKNRMREGIKKATEEFLSKSKKIEQRGRIRW